MKKLLSMLLCAVMTVTCIGAVPAHAANSDTRLRVGLTISGASTFAAPQLENVSGCKTGYTVGTVSGTAFSGSRLGAAMSTDTTHCGTKPSGAHSPSA